MFSKVIQDLLIVINDDLMLSKILVIQELLLMMMMMMQQLLSSEMLISEKVKSFNCMFYSLLQDNNRIIANNRTQPSLPDWTFLSIHSSFIMNITRYKTK